MPATPPDTLSTAAPESCPVQAVGKGNRCERRSERARAAEQRVPARERFVSNINATTISAVVVELICMAAKIHSNSARDPYHQDTSLPRRR